MGKNKRYYRKNVELFLLIDKIKLWPSRSGRLHGIKEVVRDGDYAIITTHCGKKFRIWNSRNSRAARWLRNKWVSDFCPKCGIPAWKLEKYLNTYFSEHYGSSIIYKKI
ncbi:MAG: hypothetical protein MJA31_11755 [Clostridia bacterium]|nr:hypothetical protein [Clostridia bacterium]